MKIWVMSDLHLEHSPPPKLLLVPDADICVVAGDVLTTGVVPSLEWLDANLAPHMPVIFCAGNHEFYHSSLEDSIANARRWKGSGRVHFLEDQSVDLSGVRFCGATLWSDFDLLGEEWSELAQRAAAAVLNDYTAINRSGHPREPLYPVHTFLKHVASRTFLETCLRERGRAKLVFVTHHAPSRLSVEERLLTAPLLASYASNLEHLMADGGGPDLWVHGHLHKESDYAIGSTRVVCNPRGYPKEACYRDFTSNLILEV